MPSGTTITSQVPASRLALRLVLTFLAAMTLLGAESVDDLFDRAAYDPAAMVPLAQAVSRRLPDLPAAEAVVLADRAQPYLQRLYFSDETYPGMEALGLRRYTVQAGDTFSSIAKLHGIGVGHMQALNPRVAPGRLQVGQEVKVLDASGRGLRIYIWRSRYRLFVMRPDATGTLQLLACYPVGVGSSERPTPVGVTHVAEAVRNPEWTDPDTKEVFAPDDPGNVLGGYWIRLAAGDGRFQGIGLHGYTGSASEDWIEQGGSRGCIRMLQADIDQLFGLVVTGLPVAVLE